MKRVTGIGGIFFKARDATALRAWYRKHLGIDIDEAWGGAAFEWKGESGGMTLFTIFKGDSTNFSSPFMVNFRVHQLTPLLEALRAEGCAVDEKTESSEYGDFGWVTDPEGNRIELWQPPAPDTAKGE